MNRAFLSVAAAVGLQCTVGYAILPQNAEVRYDAKNALVFEDVGRRTEKEGRSVWHGEYVALHVIRDGKASDVLLEGQMFPEHAIDTEVEEIRYADKDSVWIISRLGRRLDGAVLVDLKSGSIVREHYGKAFSISPDGSKIAYAVPMAFDCVQSAIFVDDTISPPCS